jgi:hypothetical protein
MQLSESIVRQALKDIQEEYNANPGRTDKLTDELAGTQGLAVLLARRLIQVGVKFPEPPSNQVRYGSAADSYHHKEQGGR